MSPASGRLQFDRKLMAAMMHHLKQLLTIVLIASTHNILIILLLHDHLTFAKRFLQRILRQHIAMIEFDDSNILIGLRRLKNDALLRGRRRGHIDALLDHHLVYALRIVENVKEIVLVHHRRFHHLLMLVLVTVLIAIVQHNLLDDLAVIALDNLTVVVLAQHDRFDFVRVQMCVQFRHSFVLIAAFATAEHATVLVNVMFEEILAGGKLIVTDVARVIVLA